MRPIALCLLLLSCAPALVNRPVQFSAGPGGDDLFVDVTRALVANGQTVAIADEKLGIVQTRWENTGFGYGFLDDGRGAVIWRRYSVVVAKRDAKADVTVRADTQRCAESATTADGVNIDGVCTKMFTEGLVPDHQQQLDALGTQLRTALHGG
jgi:hypothetical protein